MSKYSIDPNAVKYVTTFKPQKPFQTFQMHNEHLFWESGSALVMGCCIDNCMVRHNKLKQVLLLKKKKEGERDHAFCKNINTYYFTFFAQLKKIPCPSTKKMALLAVYKIGGQKTQCKLVPYQLIIKKRFLFNSCIYSCILGRKSSVY